MHTETTAAAIDTAAATVAADATPATVKPAKPARAKRAAKPAKPAPVEAAKPSADDEAARCAALRDTASRYYAGASKAAHMRKPARLADYVSRVSKPVQAIGPNGPSERDESGLALILSGADKRGGFDPVKLNLDLGIASRLASGGFVTVTGESFTLTKTGRERASVVVNRKAA